MKDAAGGYLLFTKDWKPMTSHTALGSLFDMYVNREEADMAAKLLDARVVKVSFHVPLDQGDPTT